MGVGSRLSLFLVMLALSTSGRALAADYDPPLYEPPVYIEEAEQAVPVEVGNGWYLRGDVGYTFSTNAGSFNYRTFDPATGTYGAAGFDSASLDSDIIFGAGFGYRFNDWIRAEVMAERFSPTFSGSTSAALPCPGQPAGTTCRGDDEAELNATSFMANAYVDLGTFARFTPYVGAGAGLTLASWNSLQGTLNCVPGAVACSALPITETSNDGISSWRFTYALMAGVAYDISDNLKVDLGYKYRHVNGGDMFRFSASEQGLGASGAQGSDSGFGQHEVRVGLRYALW